MKHRKLFIITAEGKVEVEAISIKIINGITLFLHNLYDNERYTVTEYSTGRAIAKGYPTPLGAWNAARWKLESWNHKLSLGETIKKRIKTEGAVNQ